MKLVKALPKVITNAIESTNSDIHKIIMGMVNDFTTRTRVVCIINERFHNLDHSTMCDLRNNNPVKTIDRNELHWEVKVTYEGKIYTIVDGECIHVESAIRARVIGTGSKVGKSLAHVVAQHDPVWNSRGSISVGGGTGSVLSSGGTAGGNGSSYPINRNGILYPRSALRQRVESVRSRLLNNQSTKLNKQATQNIMRRMGLVL